MPSSSKIISVLLADDHAIIRKGLRLLLEDESDIRIVAEAGDGRAAIEGVRAHAPDVVVMDISMPDVNGIEATRHIVTTFPGTKVIALSIHSGRQFIKDMLSAGAVGYILKESAPEEIIAGIRAVMQGDIYLSAAVTETVVADMVNGRPSVPDDEKEDGTLGKIAAERAVISSKLHRPPMPADHVTRPRLLAALDEGRQRPLTLISAPAGYGKSILASCWLETWGGSTAWLSLDAHDDDLHSFLFYLLAAIETMFPDAVPKTSALANASDQPKLPVLAASLLNELGRIEQDFILALDDLHLLRDASVYQLLGEVIQHLPSRMHLVLIGRRDPFLPIANLRARGQVTEIRTTDLRFRSTETAAYLRQIYDTETDDAVAAAWTEKTEGWITGLRLATLAIRHQGDSRVLSDQKDSNHYAREYLFEEVFTNQPPQIRHWLARTSILDRFCPELCEAVIGKAAMSASDALDGWQFITRLKDNNLFLINLDSENHWFRYHHMFQQLLHNQLKRRQSPEEITVLHHRASRWFEHQGLIGEAIRHALRGDDPVGAAQLVERNRQAALNADQWSLLDKWLASLPEDIRQARPEILLATAWVAYARFRVPEIQALLERIGTLVDQDTVSPIVSGEMNLFHSFLACLQGQATTCLAFAQKALDQLPVECEAGRADAEIYLGLGYQMVGQKDNAIRTMKDKLRRHPRRAGRFLTRLHATIAFVHLLSGELRQAEEAAIQLKSEATKSTLHFAELWGYFLQGCCAFQTLDLEAADRHLGYVAENRYTSHTMAAINALAGRALVQQAMGQADRADDSVRELRTFAMETNDPQNLVIAESCQARLFLLRGDPKPAIRWLQTCDVPHNPASMLFFLEIPSITQTRALIAAGSDDQLKDAETKLSALWEAALSLHNVYQMIDIGVLRSLVLSKMACRDEAFAVLGQVVTLAAPGGWIRPFVEAGAPLTVLLQQLRQKDVADDDVNELLSAIGDGEALISTPVSGALSKQAVTPQPLVEPLTNRELDILELLAQRLQNKEIADQLCVSTETVKSHLKNIYQKLDTGNRREAVQKARRLGLLPS